MVQIFESSSNVKFSCKAFLEILDHKISEQMKDICQSESTGLFVEESMAEKVLRFILEFVEEYQHEEDELFYEGELPDLAQTGFSYRTDDDVNTPSSQEFLDLPEQSSSEWEAETEEVDRDPVSWERKVQIVELHAAHPKWSVDSLKKNGAFELTTKRQLNRFKQQVARGPPPAERLKIIGNYVREEFTKARDLGKIIRGRHIRIWAERKSLEIDPHGSFKASRSWVDQLKVEFKISSRKINALQSKRKILNPDELKVQIDGFRSDMCQVIPRYSPSRVYNFDQCGFQLELITPRTLTFRGEKKVIGFSQSPTNKATHSYTVQYLINMEGLVGKTLVCLQTDTGKIGPIVEKRLKELDADNIVVVASRSGKMTTPLIREYLEKVVVPEVKEDFVLLVDSWKGHAKPELYDQLFTNHPDRPNCLIKFIPEGTTDKCQPLDTTPHRQFKNLAKEITSALEVFLDSSALSVQENWTSNYGVVKLQSILVHQMSAPKFKPMYQNGWDRAGLTEKDVPRPYLNVNKVCFTFMKTDAKGCSFCTESRFMRCSWCSKILCIKCLWIDFHYKKCEGSQPSSSSQEL